MSSVLNQLRCDESEHAHSKQMCADVRMCVGHVRIDCHPSRASTLFLFLTIYSRAPIKFVLLFLRTHQLPEPMMHTDAMARSRTPFDADEKRRRPSERTQKPLCLNADERLSRNPETRRRGTNRCARQSKTSLIRMW